MVDVGVVIFVVAKEVVGVGSVGVVKDLELGGEAWGVGVLVVDVAFVLILTNFFQALLGVDVLLLGHAAFRGCAADGCSEGECE